MDKPKIEIKVDENKIYKVTVEVKEEHLTDLFISYRDSISRNSGVWFEAEVTKLFAAEFVRKNFDMIASMIDMDTVKLMATRNLANVVTKNCD